MRALTPVALISLLVGCAPSQGAIVVEDGASMAGANHATTEALGIETLGSVFTTEPMRLDDWRR